MKTTQMEVTYKIGIRHNALSHSRNKEDAKNLREDFSVFVSVFMGGLEVQPTNLRCSVVFVRDEETPWMTLPPYGLSRLHAFLVSINALEDFERSISETGGMWALNAWITEAKDN